MKQRNKIMSKSETPTSSGAGELLAVEQVDRDAARQWLCAADPRNIEKLALIFARHRLSALGPPHTEVPSSVSEIRAITDYAERVIYKPMPSGDAQNLSPPSCLGVVERIDKFVTDFRSPWGAWKTTWWEGEVSDEAAFTADNALLHIANIARTALQSHRGEGR
jgi:hypothetical protein